jgi:hypothetical protein
VARAPVSRLATAAGGSTPRARRGVAPYPLLALAGASYLALLLFADRHATSAEQLALGALTWVVLLAVLRSLPLELRVLTVGVIAFATMGEVLGSLIWGVYTYRLENLPTFVPPAHGIVYLTGLALALSLRGRARAVVAAAALAAATWALLGLTVLPRADVAGAAGVVLLLAFLLRARNAAVYAGVFFVVAALELYGTAIGTWTWAAEVPGTGIPNGNPPSGAAAGYVWFDVMALLAAPLLLQFVRATSARVPRRGAGVPRTSDQPLPSSGPA